MLHDRAVFPLETLRSVALRLQENKEVYESPDHGVNKDSYPYPLRNCIYCAHCDRLAQKKGDARLRSRLGGTAKRGRYYYRHKPGAQCGAKSKSIDCDIVHRDIIQLLRQIKSRKGILAQLIRIAVKVNPRSNLKPVDAAEKKQQAINRADRQINALHEQYREGILSKSHYQRELTRCKQTRAEIAARPVPAAPPDFNLVTCLSMLDQLDILWERATPAQQQSLASLLFEIIYDIDNQQIDSVKLTPWAQLFLINTRTDSPDQIA